MGKPIPMNKEVAIIRMMILSFTLAIIVSLTNVKVAGSVEEIKNTTPQLPIPIVAPIVPLSVKQDKPTPKPEPLDAAPKEQIDEYSTYEITAFSAGYESTQKHKGDPGYGITADGHHVVEGVTIACEKSIPFGTRIYIKELDHTYTCQDRGQAITHGHIDIFMNSVKRAQDFGRKKMKVKIIKSEEM